MRHWVDELVEELTNDRSPLPEQRRVMLHRVSALIRDASSYLFRSERMDAVAGNIITCETTQDLARHLRDAATSAGFSYASIFVLTLSREGTPFRSRVCTSLPESWLQRYQTRNYQFVDPVYCLAHGLQAPRLVTQEPDDPPLVRSFWQDAVQRNIGSAVWVNTITCSDGSRIAVTFNSIISTRLILEGLRWDGTDLAMIANLAAEAFVQLNRMAGEATEPLSIPELRFLQMLCSGSDLNDVNSVTASYGSDISLQMSIRRKLGVRSLTQASIIAMNRGWFDDLPWERVEISTPFLSLDNEGMFKELVNID